MGLRYYKNKVTGEVKKTLNKINSPEWEEQILAPNQKFMIAANSYLGTSKLKDSQRILKARARNHSRDVLGDDNIQINLDNGLKESVSKNLLNSKGEKRRKIDDI